MKKIGFLIALVPIGLLLCNTAWVASVSNFNIGILLEGGVGLLALGILLCWRVLRRLKWLLRVLAICAGLFVAAAAFLLIYGQVSSPAGDEDVIIVLGAGIHGETVSATLASRLDKAFEYYQQHPGVTICVTGGQGPQEDIPEALAMQRYLISRGVPPEDILMEDRSTTTQENFQFAEILLRQRFPEGYKAAFVTSNFHVFRAGWTARRAGLKAAGLGAPIHWGLLPSCSLREVAAICVFAFMK